MFTEVILKLCAAVITAAFRSINYDKCVCYYYDIL